MRGEVVMRKQEFERLNQLQEQGNSRVYSNARNLGNPPPPPLYVFSVQDVRLTLVYVVAGLLNRKLEQSKSKQAISLDIVAYYFQENLEGRVSLPHSLLFSPFSHFDIQREIWVWRHIGID